MTKSSSELVASLYDDGATTVLVRGRPRSASLTHDIVTFQTGLVACCRGDHWRVPLRVEAWTGERQTHQRRFDSLTLADALDCANELVRDRSPDGVWLHDHAHLSEYFSGAAVAEIETQLATAARTADATFVTWTDETTPAADGLFGRLEDELDRPVQVVFQLHQYLGRTETDRRVHVVAARVHDAGVG